MMETISDLSVEELISGYTKDEVTHSYFCIFCGEEFEEGIMYNSRNRLVDAKRGVKEHIYDEHGGVFYNLLSLDKEVHGLSQVQEALLQAMYQDKSNKEIGELLSIKTSTVRTHKFRISQMKREAKILLALLAYIEDEKIILEDSSYHKKEEEKEWKPLNQNVEGNVLHPFFSKWNLK